MSRPWEHHVLLQILIQALTKMIHILQGKRKATQTAETAAVEVTSLPRGCEEGVTLTIAFMRSSLTT